MSSSTNHDEYNPVANLNMQPAKGILKSTRSIDEPGQDVLPETNNGSTAGMTRSESKSHKIPHFDEMNIIATYHPADKDYGHMKIEEPKTPYAPNNMIDEEATPANTAVGIDPNALTQRLYESDVSSSSRSPSDRPARRASVEDVELASQELEHRKEFETHRKQHYNEFEIVRLRKKEIEAELRALEQEEPSNQSTGKEIETTSSSRSSTDSIKPILVHHQSRDSSSSSGQHHHHVHVEDDHQDEHTLTPEERERKRQFELKRKKHYNEFRAARLADKDEDESPGTTG